MSHRFLLTFLLLTTTSTVVTFAPACGGDADPGGGGSGAAGGTLQAGGSGGTGGAAATGGSGAIGGDGGSGGESSQVDAILSLDGDANAGETVYQGLCGSPACHGPNGNDGAVNAADHTVVVPMLSDEQIVTQIIDGGGNMPPMMQLLTDQDVADVLAYLRVTFN